MSSTSNKQTFFGLSPSANQSAGWIARKFIIAPNGKVHGRHWLTFAGIALGVFALLSVSSVMNGFDKDMRQRIIGTRSELRLSMPDSSPLPRYENVLKQLEAQPSVKAASPVVRNELMLVKSSAMAATVCFGTDLPRQQAVSPVLLPLNPEKLSLPSEQWLQGIISGSPLIPDFNRDGIILGVELAQSISASVGDTVRLISPLGTIPTPLGLLPRTMSLRVAGIFIAGMPEYDRLYCYVPLSVGQFFSGYTDEIDHFDIRTFNAKKLFKTTRLLQKDFPSYKVENWSSFDTGLYQAMHFEKYLMLVVLGLMFVIASFNMTGNIFKTIVQKHKAIGILKTIGYRNNELTGVFMRQGLLIGVAGIAAGILLSLLLLTIQAEFALIQLPVGNMLNLVLPVDKRLADFVVIPLIALGVICLSIYLPARKAGKINPIALIREIT